MGTGYPTTQLRRLRYNAALRAMLQQVHVGVGELVAPIFASESLAQRKAISTMPGQFQRPIADAADYAAALADKGIPAVLIFGIPATKDASGSGAWDDQGVTQKTVAAIKKLRPELLVIADTCLCEYTDHGHCGPLSE